jgi:predicted 3-demethylubiquinone-9 3-methyltransferase (glyoxalase superfamily)
VAIRVHAVLLPWLLLLSFRSGCREPIRGSDSGVNKPYTQLEPTMLTITPFLWFDTQAEEAMSFYASIFPDTKVIAVNRAGDRVISVTYELQGQTFIGLNAGPHFKFNEAVSFFVGCDTQAQIDDLWTKLIAGGGSPSKCGWLKDKFGLSWQIVPNALGSLLSGGGDPTRAKRVMDTMLAMEKLEIDRLEAAFNGK